MRNFKKVMALAVSVAAICTSVSAFAELEYNYYEGEVLSDLASYDADAHALTLNVATNGDATVLVLDNGVVDTAATGEDILYINQYTEDETAYASMKLKGSALEVGTYVVKYGYTDSEGGFAIANGSIVVTEKQAETVKVTFVLGDVDADGDADDIDSAFIMTKVLGGAPIVGSSEVAIGNAIVGNYVLGDVDADGDADDIDSAFVMTKVLGGAPIVGSSEVAIGSTVTVEAPAN